MKRRDVFRVAIGCALFAPAEPLLFAAKDFWNRKPAAEWSGEEIAELTTRSPWAKPVNAEFTDDTEYTTGSRGGPTIGRGGALGAPDTSSPAVGGAKRQQAVTVIWESAQPIRLALGFPLPAEFKDRYVIGVTGLPLSVMESRKGPKTEAVSAEDASSAGRQRRMIEQMKFAATLEARGKEPEQPGVVQPTGHALSTYLFGFSRELLPLTVDDREAVFSLQTGLIAIKAKFDPKAMLYRGGVAL